MQEPEQLVEGSAQVGIQAGPQSMYSESGGQFTVARQEGFVYLNKCSNVLINVSNQNRTSLAYLVVLVLE